MRTCIVPYRRKRWKKKTYTYQILLYQTMNNNIGVYACTCGVIIRNGGEDGAQGVGSRTHKESHEPTTPSLGRNARAVCVVHARQNGHRRRHAYRPPYPPAHPNSPVRIPPSARPGALTAFAAKAAAMPVIHDRSRRLVRPHSLLPPPPTPQPPRDRISYSRCRPPQ